MKQLIIYVLYPDEVRYYISTDVDMSSFSGVYVNSGEDEAKEEEQCNIHYDEKGVARMKWVTCEDLHTLDITDLTAVIEMGFLL